MPKTFDAQSVIQYLHGISVQASSKKTQDNLDSTSTCGVLEKERRRTLMKKDNFLIFLPLKLPFIK